MKRIVLFFVIAITMLLATACGGRSAPAATQAPAHPAATQAPAQQQPAATDTQAQQPTATGSSASTGDATMVNITLADNTIESSVPAFKVGVPYTFVIANTGHHMHNFNINTPASVTGSVQNSQATALLSVSQDQLGIGASTTVEYTFPDTAAGAQLEFACLIQRHYEDGMKLAITVTK